MDGRRPRPLRVGAKLAERLEVNSALSALHHRVEPMLLAYIHRSITHRVHVLDKARPGHYPSRANDHGKTNQCDRPGVSGEKAIACQFEAGSVQSFLGRLPRRTE